MIGDNREVSGFGISIGTGLALETIFNPTEEQYDKLREFDRVNIANYDELVISWYTIIRNILASLSDRDRAIVNETNKIKEISSIANMEIAMIESLCNDAGISITILAIDYSKIKFFIFNDLTKPTQKAYAFNIAAKSLKKVIANNIHKEQRFRFTGRVLLVSHISMDLLNRQSNKLELLESNTGKVIKPILFNKKYRKSAYDYSMLPFTPELLLILGDSSGLLRTLSPKEKKHTVNILMGKKVHSSTTVTRVRDILLRDNLVGDFIRRRKIQY